MKAIQRIRLLVGGNGMAMLFCSAAMAAGPLGAATNIVPNGDFADPKEPLRNWQYKYEKQATKDANGRVDQGESFYFGNAALVSVVPENEGRKHALRLNVETQFLADNPGVKVDSFPIPVKPGGRYHFSCWARSTGPNCRIMLEGWKWRPGVTPHANPTIYELRRCYRFEQLFFGDVKGGTMGGVDHRWKHSSQTVPGTDHREFTKLAQEKFDEVMFLTVHIVGIGGVKGELFVNEVVVERVN